MKGMKPQILESISPLLRWSEALGLSPLEPSIAPSRCIILVAFFTLFSLPLTYPILTRPFSHSVITTISDIFVTFLRNILCILSIICFLRGRKFAIDIFQKVDTTFIEDRKQLKRISRLLKFQLALVSIIYTILALSGIYFVIIGSGFLTGLTLGLLIYWSFMHIIVKMQFLTLLQLLRFQFQCLNSNIQKIQSNNIQKCASMHIQLYRICQSANQVYGQPMLFLILYDFLNYTFASYFSVLYMLGATVPDRFTSNPVFPIMWTASVSAGTFCILAQSNSVMAEAEQTGRLVCMAITNTQDKKTREELHLFSYQLLHAKIELTASGFLPLSVDLITSMAKAILTHLVILVQFQLASRDNSN